MRRAPAFLVALGMFAAAADRAWSAPGPGEGGRGTGFEAVTPFAAPAEAPRPTLALAAAEGAPLASLFRWHRTRPAALTDSAAAAAADSADRAERARQPALNAARVRVVLRSLTMPGWGQSSVGRPTAARVFGLVEVGVWTSYLSFRIQQNLRTSAFEHTARLFAGIRVDHRDEEFRRIVGQYSSSDEYNRLVVFRDAATLFLGDPDHLDYAGYHDYIAAHSLKGADTWSWDSPENARRYRGQRKSSQRAALRANTALALALVNRLVSVLHAARLHEPADAGRGSWNLEVTPDPGTDPTAFRVGVRTRF